MKPNRCFNFTKNLRHEGQQRIGQKSSVIETDESQLLYQGSEVLHQSVEEFKESIGCGSRNSWAVGEDPLFFNAFHRPIVGVYGQAIRLNV